MRNIIGWIFAVIFGATFGLGGMILGFLFHYARLGFILGHYIAREFDGK